MPRKTNSDTGTKALRPLKSLRQRKSLGQMVYENLRQAIVREALPGHAARRESDRRGSGDQPHPGEAIHKLERERFIERLAHGGSGAGAEPAGYRRDLRHPQRPEGYAARLAALNHRADDLDPLEAKINEFQRLLEKTAEERPEVNTQFHDLLYTLSRSPRLIAMIYALRDHIYRYRQII
jgi:DNA-binding GntR family transcriptional regulator